MNKSISQYIQEITQYIPYTVAKEENEIAKKLIFQYKKNEKIIRLLHEHYTAVPNAREEAVIKVAKLLSKHDIYLFVLLCKTQSWLYVVTNENVVFIGEYKNDTEIITLPPEIVQFFDYQTQEEFWQNCPPVEKLKEYRADDAEHHCPACDVLEGEEHLLGCVVEICPWCNGQLQKCNCRFDQLKVDEITKESQLEELMELLQTKGRIPFTAEHSPAYPGTSKGLDTGGERR